MIVKFSQIYFLVFLHVLKIHLHILNESRKIKNSNSYYLKYRKIYHTSYVSQNLVYTGNALSKL